VIFRLVRKSGWPAFSYPMAKQCATRRHVMPVTIENLTNRPVLLRFNSGHTLHLAPRTISLEIRDVEINRNAKIQMLMGRRVIALQQVTEETPVTRRPTKKPTKSKKRKK
jgi:hypothetical protein